MSTPIHNFAVSISNLNCWTKDVSDREKSVIKAKIVFNVKVFIANFASAGAIAMLALTIFSGLGLIWGAIGIGLFLFLQQSTVAELKKYHIPVDSEERLNQLENKNLNFTSEGVCSSLGVPTIPNWKPMLFQLGSYITFFQWIPIKKVKASEASQPAVVSLLKRAMGDSLGRGAAAESDELVVEQVQMQASRFKRAPGL